MGNTIKLVSGFILFVIGILIAYETSVYNLLDILLIVGLIISIVGLILIVSYFVEYNADRTTNMIKDFISSNNINAPNFNKLERKSKDDKPRLRVQNDFNEYDDSDYNDLVLDDDYRDFDTSQYIRDDYEDNPKAVFTLFTQRNH